MNTRVNHALLELCSAFSHDAHVVCFCSACRVPPIEDCGQVVPDRLVMIRVVSHFPGNHIIFFLLSKLPGCNFLLKVAPGTGNSSITRPDPGITRSIYADRKPYRWRFESNICIDQFGWRWFGKCHSDSREHGPSWHCTSRTISQFIISYHEHQCCCYRMH